MNKNPKIEILMATYNGENYLSEQIESLLDQTYENWILLIRDDGSKDSTVDIIKIYEKKYPMKIKLLIDGKKGLGAKNNFLELLKNSKENYIMFCDQDDVWLPNKIEITLEKMLKEEKGATLVHTDLKVVNKNLKIINDSFWKFQNLNPKRKQYNYLIVQNNITGCTMMLNKELVNLLKINFPFQNGIMHDWIIGIIASLKGKIEYLNEPTILYRQHGKNDIGAKKYNLIYFLEKFLKNRKEIKLKNEQVKYQIEEIITKLECDDKIKKEVVKYIELKNIFFKKIWIIKKRYLKYGIYRKIGQIIFE